MDQADFFIIAFNVYCIFPSVDSGSVIPGDIGGWWNAHIHG